MGAKPATDYLVAVIDFIFTQSIEAYIYDLINNYYIDFLIYQLYYYSV